ncbi:MAG: type II toxin-antitoxin system PemK/MazF family toxin [Gemmataceae bacterium]|nr:type II toxin-antitoxin system PemK/MazF family toxin [Gemmataceae bacterium]
MTEPIARGRVWDVQFDPQVGSEMASRHPAVVVSSDAVGVLPLRIVVPITGADLVRKQRPWHVLLQPTAGNGLTKPSVADTFQVKSVAVERFVKCRGQLTAEELAEVLAGVALCLELGE